MAGGLKKKVVEWGVPSPHVVCGKFRPEMGLKRHRQLEQAHTIILHRNAVILCKEDVYAIASLRQGPRKDGFSAEVS